MSVSDTGMGTTCRIPVSGECPLFFFSFFRFFDTRRHSSDASDTPAVKKKKIPGYLSSFRSSGEFRCVSAVNLFRASTRWMSFFFLEYFRYLLSLSLECWMTMIVQISACRIIPHFFFLLSTEQRFRWTILSLLVFISASNSLFSLHPWKTVPFYFKMKQVFIFRSKGWTYWDMHLNRAYFFVFLQGIRWIMCIYCAPSSFDTWCGTELTLAFYIYKYIYFFFSLRLSMAFYIWVCLDRIYFAEIENLLLKSL